MGILPGRFSFSTEVARMITPQMIEDGLDNGAVSIADSPNGDGAVCRIGPEWWFYFDGETAEQSTAADYTANVPREDIVREIMETLDDFREDPSYQDEYHYYEAFLRENLPERRPKQPDRTAPKESSSHNHHPQGTQAAGRRKPKTRQR